MKNLFVLVLCLLLVACATAPLTLQSNNDDLFHDKLFAAAPERVGAVHVFALSPAMQAYRASDIASRLRSAGRQTALVDALYSKKQLKLEYDSTMTRNAAEAFEAKSGNCLSLVLLTASFAKALGITVQYQSVYTDQTVSRSGGIVYLSGHVNLTLGSANPTGTRLLHPDTTPLTIDFVPSKELGEQRVRVIRENTIVAMYLNNRAAETLAEGKLDEAYWWSRRAIDEDPTLLSSYNTLGVVYRRHGNLKESEQILRYVVEREPGNVAPVSNMVVVLNALGKTAEAQQWAQKLKQIQPNPPFYFFDLGLQAMKEKRYELARDMFAKEVERAAYYHEFNAWLAAAYYLLGDVAQARKYLTIALQNSTTKAEQDLYSARLEAIRPRARTARAAQGIR